MHIQPISPTHANPLLDRPDRLEAHDRYVMLRGKLLALQAAAVPDRGAIDATVMDLEQAQLDYKASFGLLGNNPC